MPTAAHIRLQVESALAARIPSALTPQARHLRPVAATGIAALDALLEGGFPVGAVSELAGPACAGRTTVAMALLAALMREARVCAWVDVSNTLDPASAAAAGVNLERLLWVRCGTAAAPQAPLPVQECRLPGECLQPPAPVRGLYAGGWGAHPRQEVRGLPQAVGRLLGEPGARAADAAMATSSRRRSGSPAEAVAGSWSSADGRPWSRMEQGMRAADLLLQAGGFSAIVMDMGSVAPEHVTRVPLATWHRYRVAAERTQCCFVLLTQHASAKSSAELVLRLGAAEPLADQAAVLTGLRIHAEVVRRRFAPQPVTPLRKPPQGTRAEWTTHTAWATCR